MVETCISHGSIGGMVATSRISTKERYKHYYRYSGICSDVRFGAHRNSLNNLTRAIAERVLFVPDGAGGLKKAPKPLSRGYLWRVMQPFHNKLKGAILSDNSYPIHPLSDEDFVSLYSGSKAKRYQAACDSLVRDPVVPRDAHITAFVKVEKINFSAKSDPCPRVIQPRSFRYGAELGKQIKHLEKPLFKLIDGIYGGPTVLKGYDCIGMATALKGMWDEFKNPVALGLDASRFDQHCSLSMLEWEHSIWLMLAANRKLTRKLLKWQLRNLGRAYLDEGKIKYSTLGCRMSGDMNTSSGNCLIMCAMVWCYMQSLGITHFRLANNGDDCVLIFEHSELSKLKNLDSWFTKLGYTMKRETPVTEFEKIQFCQTNPVYDGIGYRMSRDPRVSLSKDLTCTLDLSNSHVLKLWHEAMHHGGIALTNGLPIFKQFYSMFPVSGEKIKKNETTLDEFNSSGLNRLAPKIKQIARDVTDYGRYSFWLAFGILPDMQVILEERFNNMNLLNCPLVDIQEYSELSLLVEN